MMVVIAVLLFSLLAGETARRARGGKGECCQNFIYHTCQLIIDVGVPKSQNTKAGFLKMGIAYLIAHFLLWHSVLRSINFNDQAMGVFGEIQNVSIQRHLPPEMHTLLVQDPQMPPGFDFFRRHGFS